MSIRRTKECRPDLLALAVTDLHTLVGELRRIGLGTHTALGEVARKMRLAARRVRHLYYQDEPVQVTTEQQSWIAAGTIRVLVHLGDEHMRAAARCHAKAEEIRERQSQLELALGDAKCAPGSGTYALQCAA